ncbi:hypothetical protein [Paenibacillus graminis]
MQFLWRTGGNQYIDIAARMEDSQGGGLAVRCKGRKQFRAAGDWRYR